MSPLILTPSLPTVDRNPLDILFFLPTLTYYEKAAFLLRSLTILLILRPREAIFGAKPPPPAVSEALVALEQSIGGLATCLRSFGHVKLREMSPALAAAGRAFGDLVAARGKVEKKEESKKEK